MAGFMQDNLRQQRFQRGHPFGRGCGVTPYSVGRCHEVTEGTGRLASVPHLSCRQCLKSRFCGGDTPISSARFSYLSFFLELVQYLVVCGFSSIILSNTRKKFAGILCVWQGFLTQDSAKFAEKTCARRC